MCGKDGAYGGAQFDQCPELQRHQRHGQKGPERDFRDQRQGGGPCHRCGLGKQHAAQVGDDDRHDQARHEEGQLDPRLGQAPVHRVAQNDCDVQIQQDARHADRCDGCVCIILKADDRPCIRPIRFEVAPFDQIAGDWPADQGSDHKPQRGNRDPQFLRVGQICGAGHFGRPGDGGAVPSDQGGRAKQHACGGVIAKEHSPDDTDHVLQHNHHNGQRQQDQQRFAPCDQITEARIQPDACEEQDEKQIARLQFKAEFDPGNDIEHQRTNGSHQASGYCIWNVEVAQQGAAVVQGCAKNENREPQRGRDKGGDDQRHCVMSGRRGHSSPTMVPS